MIALDGSAAVHGDHRCPPTEASRKRATTDAGGREDLQPSAHAGE